MSAPFLRRIFYSFMVAVLVSLLAIDQAVAVVGQAERFDPVREKDLEEFHNNVVNEETSPSSAKTQAERLNQQLTIRRAALAGAKGNEKDKVSKEVEALRQQLLQLPKRRKFHAEAVGQYQFNGNSDGRTIYEKRKSDSIFYLEPTALVDLSGKNTTLSWEVGGGKQWNIKTPIKDYWEAHETLRYRKRYFKKIFQSANSTINRNSSKTQEIDNNKIRWDASNSTAFNYALTRRFAVNTDFAYNRRYFADETFDQDSNWQGTASPSMFWNITPKSRVAAGYSYGVSRIRTKTGDTDSHEIHGGYFGRITRKSSASLDMAYSYQRPRSTDTAQVRTFTTGIGYIYQVTPKTQVTTQILRSLQYTTSNAVAGSTNEDSSVPLTSKNDSHFTNTSLSVSLNTRLNRRISVSASSGIYHLKTHTAMETSTSADNETQQFGIPFSFSATYFIKRWMTFTITYNYNFKTGDESSDKIRGHILEAVIRLIF